MLIFLHLPKTAGQSFRTLLERRFGAERVVYVNTLEERDRLLAEYAPGRFAAAVGHMPYGLHTCLAEPCTYFTVLREPVDRYLSHFYYMWNDPRHPMHATLHREGLDLAAYLERVAPRRYMELNTQVKRLLDTDFRGTWWGVRRRGPHDVVGERRALGEDELREAERNLTEKVVHFGVYEQLAESIRLFAHLLGGGVEDLPLVNATPRRAAVDELPAALVERIREANRLDVELYGFALASFDRAQKEREAGVKRAASKRKAASA